MTATRAGRPPSRISTRSALPNAPLSSMRRRAFLLIVRSLYDLAARAATTCGGSEQVTSCATPLRRSIDQGK